MITSWLTQWLRPASVPIHRLPSLAASEHEREARQLAALLHRAEDANQEMKVLAGLARRNAQKIRLAHAEPREEAIHLINYTVPCLRI